MRRGVRVAIIVMMIVLVLLPIIPLLGWAFSTGWTYPNLLPNGFSMTRIMDTLNDPKYIQAIINSIILSVTVMVTSLLLGFFAAKTLGTKEFRGSKIVEICMLLPALASGISILFGLRYVFIHMNIYLSYISLVLAQVVFCLPYIIMLLIPVFRNYDTDYEAQAATLGVGKLGTFVHVTIPAVKSGLAVACMYTFMVSWSIFLVVSFFAPIGFDTVATLLVPKIQMLGSYSTIAAMTILFILPSLFIFIISSKMLGDTNNGGKNL